VNSSEPQYLGLTATTWAKIGTIVLLFAALFWPNLRRLWYKTNPFTGEANWGHAIAVPLIGLYYLYIHREELLRANPRQFIWDRFLRPTRIGVAVGMIACGVVAFLANTFITGTVLMNVRDILVSATDALGILGVLVLALDWSLAITLFGIGLYVYGIYPGQNDYIKDLGMVVTLFGICLLMCGRDVMKIAWFPVVFLICALPWPGLVYSWVASPLQALAAHIAVEVLKLTGVNAATSGTKILIAASGTKPPRMLNVAEACAGMRSLMTFISVGAAVAFLSARPLWQKLTITFSAVPIAIFCNVMRVSGQGLLDHYLSESWSEGFAHQFVGLIMLVPAFFLILLVGWVLDQIFIEEAEAPDASPAGNGPKVVAIPTRANMIPVMTPAPARPATVESKPPAPVAAPTATASRVAAPIPAPRPATVPPPPAGGKLAGMTPPRPRTAASMPRPSSNPSALRPSTAGIVPPKMAPRPVGTKVPQSPKPPVATPAVPPSSNAADQSVKSSADQSSQSQESP
jgi:exosortase